MSFISIQEFNDDGEIKLLKKHKYVLETVSENDDSLDKGIIGGKARVDHVYSELKPADVRESFKTLNDAENAVLEPFEYFWPASCPPLSFINEDLRPAHRLSRAVRGLKRTSKRGAGNTIVVHPDDEQIVRDALSKGEIDDRFTKEDAPNGEMNLVVTTPYFSNADAIQIITHTGAEAGMPLVLYVGEHEYDKPLIYVEGHGLFLNEIVAPIVEQGVFVDIT